MFFTTEDGDLMWSRPDGALGVCFKKISECPRCHRMVAFAVHRPLRMSKPTTVCVECDAQDADAEAWVAARRGKVLAVVPLNGDAALKVPSPRKSKK